MPAAVLSVLVQARGIQQTNAQLASTQGLLGKAEGAANRMGKQLAKGLKIAALGAAAGITAAVKAAVDFDKEMRNVNSIAQLGERRYGKLRDKVLALAGPTAQAPKTLAAGLYDLVSSGFDSSESLQILDKSARAATAGLTTTEVSTKAVAAVLNAYHLAAGQAGDVSDVLFEIVNRGVITFEELAQNVGDVLPYSSSLGVDLREVGASIATMTKAGISAPETMTRIKSVMASMLKPSKDLTKAIHEQGYESGQAMINALGFQGTLDALAKSTGGSKEAMAGLFPNIRALGGALALTGENSKRAAEDLQGMKNASGATAKALSQQERSISFQWGQLRANIEVLAIKFGSTLLPAISKVMEIVSDPHLTVDQKVGKVFDLISEGAQKALTAATGLASKYGPKIIASLATGFAKAWTEMDPLGKLFTAAAVVRVVGGKGAIGAIGATIGRWLGIGVRTAAVTEIAAGGGIVAAAETSAAPALAATAASGAWSPASPLPGSGAARQAAASSTSRAMLENAFGGFTLASAGSGLEKAAQAGLLKRTAAKLGNSSAVQFAGGFATSVGGALRSIPWVKLGGLGLGLALADNVMNEFGRRVNEHSDDVKTALDAISNKQDAVSFTRENILGPFINPLFGNKDVSGEKTAAANLKAQYEEMLHKRVQLSAATQESLRNQLGELDVSKKTREQLEEMLNLARQGSRLKMGVQIGMDPQKLERLGNGFRTLRSGVLTSMQDIGRVVQANAQIISTQLPKGSQDARDKMAENFRSAAKAVALGMQEGDISVKQGVGRMRSLLLNAQLLSGNDPLELAKGFRSSWKKAGEISDQQQHQVISDLGKMPPKARAKAFELMIGYAKGLAQGKQIPEQDMRDLRSSVVSQFSALQSKGSASATNLAIGVAGSFGSMGSAVANVLSIIQENTNHSLGAFGADPLKYAIKQVGSILGLTPQKKQEGGFVVGGSGSGDRPGFTGEVGAYVLNREASSAYGFNRGGRVPLALEPGERYFTRGEVKALGGAGTLEAMNRSVPRFQSGGEIGKAQIVGPPGPLLNIGHGVVQRAEKAAQEYIAKHKPKGGPGYSGPAFGPAGTSSYKGVLMATWVRQALEYAAGHGVNAQPTSGYRSHAQNVSEGRDYTSEHEFSQYPRGAVDFGGKVDPASKVVKDAVVAATRSFKYPLLAPIGFRDDGHASGTGHQLGGLIKALSTGGPVPPAKGELVGASYYGGPTDHVSGTVGAAGVSLPGKMSFAELAMGHALGGLPFHTKLKVGYNGKSVIAEKLDIGLGGDDVAGHNRAIDLWYETANAIGMPGTGVVKVSPASGSAPGLTAGQKKLAEGKARKSNYEHRLHALMAEVSAAQTVPSKEHKLWRLIKFWGRVGIFDKDEHSHIIEAVQNAASQVKPQGAVNVLSGLADYAKGHGEITGQDPSNFQDLVKAIERAQDRGAKKREKAVERQKKRIEGIHKRVEDKIAKRAAFPDIVQRLAGQRRGADVGEEFASQLVTLEPENLSDAYVGQERGAYGNELNRLLGWRNSVVGAQSYATEEIARFQQQIADIEALGTAPANIDVISKGKKGAKGKAGLGGATNVSVPAGAYDKQKYKIPLLQKAIEDAQTMRDETWAGELEEIQGLSGPSGIIGSLPSEPTAGSFGGRIFEIQNSIRELALKVNPATGGGTDNTLLEELLRQANQRTAVSEAQKVVLEGWDARRQGFAGMFATGGVIPAGMWGVAGETGQPEIVQGPARVFSPQESQAMTSGGGASTVTVQVNGDIVQEKGDTRDPIEVLEGDHRFVPLVQKAARGARGTGLNTPGGARR